MLFLSSLERGKGLGRKLLEYGIRNYRINEVTVNEQNHQAVRFYRHMGFEEYKRTDFDEEGNPLPSFIHDVEHSILITIFRKTHYKTNMKTNGLL